LLLGDLHATDEEMIHALERCRLKNWFEKLPEGLDSYLDEGAKVSVGEKQRLGVVRALLRKSELLFLDEPTSSLDLDTEEEVMEVIHRVRKGKTTVMITHRLSTITGADRILVFQAGNIVETGKHQELLDKNGVYANLVNLYIQKHQAA
ncbi:MAG: ATP-binding cassette domain-containing protein, partial [Chitinivibrionales bacterium]|nr:ATP-binding cassette domain-containing protein [Chitinivibrionales bacterium]MBD3357758.1 ATP-binding cassette domain-containing protein [Chitinivibrionales bacterium]